jgi:phage N-6-adenine-methyltransferase
VVLEAQENKMNEHERNLMFSSKEEEWETPIEFVRKLETLFGKFTLDPAATKENAKANKFFTKEDDGLNQSWKYHNVFVNPPYGRGITQKWVKKAFEEAKQIGTQVVVLIPARTDTKYWHRFCMCAKEIYFVKGRLKFINKMLNGAENPAAFPSAVIYFNGMDHLSPVVYTLEQ